MVRDIRKIWLVIVVSVFVLSFESVWGLYDDIE